MKTKPKVDIIEVPVSPEVWESIEGEERVVFTSVVGWGKRSAVCAWLRSDKPLRRELRDLIADYIDGKYKPPAHRPARPMATTEHNAWARRLKREQRAIAAQLKAKGIPSPMEVAKAELCKKYDLSESQLKRDLEAWAPLKVIAKA